MGQARQVQEREGQEQEIYVRRPMGGPDRVLWPDDPGGGIYKDAGEYPHDQQPYPKVGKDRHRRLSEPE